ncbi:MAG: DNA polymerase III subunit delta [Minisyncoccia bacterium]
MIYILIGEEGFYIKEKIDELKKGEKIYISLQEKDSIDNILKYLNNRLLGKKPTIVIKNFPRNSKFNLSEKILKELSKNDAIFVVDKKNEDLIKKLKNLDIDYKIYEIPKLEFKNIRDFEEFIGEIIEKYGIKIPKSYIKTFAKIFINQPAVLIQELKKLSYYKKGRELTKDEINYLIKWPSDSQIFELTNCLLENKYREFILRLKREINVGTKIENILGLLNKTLIRILLLKKAKSYKDEERLGLKYGYRKILKQYAKNIPEEKIKKIIKILANIDRRYKKFLIKEDDVIFELAENLINI